MKTVILYYFYKFIRSLFFWIPKTETEIAMDRLTTILSKKEKLDKELFSGKLTKKESLERIQQLLEWTTETMEAMSDGENLVYESEKEHRKNLKEICDILIDDLKDLKKVGL